MNDYLKLLPELRFSIFTDHWEICKLENVLKKNGNRNKKLSISNVESISNKTGFTKQTKQFDNYVVASTDLSNYYVISEKQFAYNPSRINVGSIAYKKKGEELSIISPLYVSFETKEKLNDGFLWNWFKTYAFEKQRQRISEGGVRDILSFKQLSNMVLLIPAKEEQEKIGRFFEQLDKLITLQERKLDLLKKQKQGYMQKMFPKAGERVPELRFAGFSDDWKINLFKNLYKKNLEKNEKKFKSTQTISISKMKFNPSGNGASTLSLEKYKVLRIGDIAFEGHKNKKFSYGRFVLNDIGDGIMSPRFTTLRPVKKYPINFWKQYIHYEPIMRNILVRSTKLGTMMNELDINDLNNQKILVPDKLEQEKIGSFFKLIDDNINLQSKKLDSLKGLKKGFLQKMFV